jgi:hypothetical protein
MSGSAEDKPKIIVDEDWKSQVEQERAQQKESTGEPSADEKGEDQATGDELADDGVTVRRSDEPLPPASFELLLSTLVTQTLACLGQIPDPLEHKPIVQLDLAQHHIDMLAVLEDKTRGNLTPDESHALEEMLHQLRMLFITIKQHVSQ